MSFIYYKSTIDNSVINKFLNANKLTDTEIYDQSFEIIVKIIETFLYKGQNKQQNKGYNKQQSRETNLGDEVTDIYESDNIENLGEEVTDDEPVTSDNEEIGHEATDENPVTQSLAHGNHEIGQEVTDELSDDELSDDEAETDTEDSGSYEVVDSNEELAQDTIQENLERSEDDDSDELSTSSMTPTTDQMALIDQEGVHQTSSYEDTSSTIEDDPHAHLVDGNKYGIGQTGFEYR